MYGNKTEQYLQRASQDSQERWMNADGFVDDGMNFTAREDFMGVDGSQSQTMPAQQSLADVARSKPYVITVSNVSAAAVNNFDVLGAFAYLQNSGFSNGSLTISGITISSGIPNVTYQQFLYQSQISPFSVGMTYIYSLAGAAAQISQTITINTQDANGNQALSAMLPILDPYQQLSTATILKQLYRIDGFTKLTFSTILASAVFQVYFYPTDNINLARGLAGMPVGRQYGNPNIVRGSIRPV